MGPGPTTLFSLLFLLISYQGSSAGRAQAYYAIIEGSLKDRVLWYRNWSSKAVVPAEYVRGGLESGPLSAMR